MKYKLFDPTLYVCITTVFELLCVLPEHICRGVHENINQGYLYPKEYFWSCYGVHGKIVEYLNCFVKKWNYDSARADSCFQLKNNTQKWTKFVQKHNVKLMLTSFHVCYYFVFTTCLHCPKVAKIITYCRFKHKVCWNFCCWSYLNQFDDVVNFCGSMSVVFIVEQPPLPKKICRMGLPSSLSKSLLEIIVTSDLTGLWEYMRTTAHVKLASDLPESQTCCQICGCLLQFTVHVLQGFREKTTSLNKSY